MLEVWIFPTQARVSDTGLILGTLSISFKLRLMRDLDLGRDMFLCGCGERLTREETLLCSTSIYLKHFLRSF